VAQYENDRSDQGGYAVQDYNTKQDFWQELLGRRNKNPQSGPVIQVASSGSLDGILSPEDTSGSLVKKEPISVPPKTGTDAVGVGNKTPTDWSVYYNKLQPYRQYSDTVQPSRVDPTRTGQVTNADGSQNIWITRTKVDGTWHSDEQIYIDPEGNSTRSIVDGQYYAQYNFNSDGPIGNSLFKKYSPIADDLNSKPRTLTGSYDDPQHNDDMYVTSADINDFQNEIQNARDRGYKVDVVQEPISGKDLGKILKSGEYDEVVITAHGTTDQRIRLKDGNFSISAIKAIASQNNVKIKTYSCYVDQYKGYAVSSKGALIDAVVDLNKRNDSKNSKRILYVTGPE